MSVESRKDLRGAKDTSSDIPQAQEKTRGRLAYVSFGIFGVVVIGSLAFIIFSHNFTTDKLNGILTILSAVTGTVGFVMGFYFGQNNR